MRTREHLRTVMLMALAIGVGLAVGCGGGDGGGDTPTDADTAGNDAATSEAGETDEDGAEVSDQDLAAWGGFGGRTDVKVCVDDSVETSGLMEFRSADESIGAEGAGYVSCAEKAVDEFKKANPDSDVMHEAVMAVDIPEDGTWYPWVLTWWLDDCGNSIYVRITDENGGLVQKPQLVEDATTKAWHWKRASGGGLDLKKGTYKVGLINREDGARVSCLLFTTKPYDTYTPVNPES